MKNKIFEKQMPNIPEKIDWCKKCVISTARPRITFNKNGVCFACENNYKNNINWKSRERIKEIT